MERFLTQIGLALLISVLGPPGPAQTWVATTDDYIADEVDRVIQTRDGRFLAVAHTGRALALIKRNSDGSLLWQRLFTGSITGSAGRAVLELPDGRIVAAGHIFINDHGNVDASLVIVSADAGTVLLQRAFGGPGGDDSALDLVPVRSGGYLLIGETLSWSAPGRGMFVVRVDSGGGLMWAKVFHTSGGDDVLYSGVELSTGEFLVAGSSGLVLRLAPGGDLIWSRSYGLAEIRQIAPTAEGNFVIAGWRPDGTSDAAELIKIDASGQILWRGSYGQTGVAYRFFAVAPQTDGGYLAGGEVNGPGFTDFHGWVAHLDAAGGIIWQRHLNDGGEVHSVATTNEGAVLVGGHRGSFPRMMVGRLDAAGQVSSCTHPVTSAARIASNGTWMPVAATVIEPATLEVRDTADPINDAPTPGDQTSCHGGPTYSPSEVSPPAASKTLLVFNDDRTLQWEDGAPSSSALFHLYRGDLADLRLGRGPDCLIAGLATNTYSDAEIPAPGASYLYLVAGWNAAGRGTLGHASDGAERLPVTPCP